MHRDTASPSGRPLLFFVLMALIVLALYDLSGPDPGSGIVVTRQQVLRS